MRWGDQPHLEITADGRQLYYDPALWRAMCAHEMFRESEKTMSLKEEIADVTMTTLKPLLVTACYCSRYFNRDESKAERVKQAVLDVELLLKELGLADATRPAAK